MFSGAFRKPYQSAFASAGVAATPVVNWWEAGGATGAMFAYQPKGAADYATSKVNLANPGTNDATDGAAIPTWGASDGWTFNGSTQQLLSGADAGQKPCTMIARINLTNLTSVHTMLGSVGAGGMQFRTETTSGNLRLVAQNVADILQASGGVAASTDVVVAASYSGSGVIEFYVNGVSIGGGTNNQSLSTRTISIGVNAGSSGSEWFAGKMLALAKYDNVLTDDQVAAISTAAAAL
jgi:hypothetical protein